MREPQDPMKKIQIFLNIPEKQVTSGNPFQITPDDLYLDTLTNIKGKITKRVDYPNSDKNLHKTSFWHLFNVDTLIVSGKMSF